MYKLLSRSWSLKTSPVDGWGGDSDDNVQGQMLEINKRLDASIRKNDRDYISSPKLEVPIAFLLADACQ